MVGRDGTAAQQVTAEGVAQRITRRAIAGAEPTLKVGAPDIVGSHNWGYPARSRRGPPPPFTALAEPLAPQQVADGAQRRPVLLRRPRQQLGAQFLRPPTRMLAPQPDYRLGLSLGDRPRHSPRSWPPFLQPARTLRHIARQPLVADPAAHAVFLAQLRHTVFARSHRCDKLHPRIHGTDLRPRHPRPPPDAVTLNLLPSLPVYSVT